jgi:hypothetical protein
VPRPSAPAAGLRGRAWDVFGEPPLEALDALGRIRGVYRAGLAGDHLRALTEPGVGGEDLTGGLGAEGIRTPRVVNVEPSLEDVFLSLADV